MKGATNHLTPGEKVAYYRRRRGMSQSVLAELVGKTTSWIEKIESGRANLQMLPNIAHLAQVLDISPLELLPDDIVQVDANTRGRSVPALRAQLLSYRFVNPRYRGDAADPITLAALRRLVAAVWDAYQSSRFGYVVAELYRLVPIAYATTQTGDEADRANARVQLAYLYQAAATVLTKVGETDLAFTCADHGERLVQDSADLAARLSVQRSIAHALLSNALYDDALAVIDQTVSVPTNGLNTPELVSAIGTAHLVGAMVAARSRDRQLSAQHLAAAQRSADALGADGNFLWTAFGPTNVAIHRVSVAAELGDYQQAAELGQQVDASPMPMERQIRHRLEVARALHFRHRQPEALALILDAERLAAEQVRRHFLTHALLHEWVRNRRIPVSPELHGLARRAGVITV